MLDILNDYAGRDWQRSLGRCVNTAALRHIKRELPWALDCTVQEGANINDSTSPLDGHQTFIVVDLKQSAISAVPPPVKHTVTAQLVPSSAFTCTCSEDQHKRRLDQQNPPICRHRLAVLHHMKVEDGFTTEEAQALLKEMVSFTDELIRQQYCGKIEHGLVKLTMTGRPCAAEHAWSTLCS